MKTTKLDCLIDQLWYGELHPADLPKKFRWRQFSKSIKKLKLSVNKKEQKFLFESQLKQATKEIEDFIVNNGFDYTVQNLKDSYKKYWIKGYYMSYTAEICMKALEGQIKFLVESEGK